MSRHPFGWSYPPGAENDPNAPYNQPDDEYGCPECEENPCVCEVCKECHLTMPNCCCAAAQEYWDAERDRKKEEEYMDKEGKDE